MSNAKAVAAVLKAAAKAGVDQEVLETIKAQLPSTVIKLPTKVQKRLCSILGEESRAIVTVGNKNYFKVWRVGEYLKMRNRATKTALSLRREGQRGFRPKERVGVDATSKSAQEAAQVPA